MSKYITAFRAKAQAEHSERGRWVRVDSSAAVTNASSYATDARNMIWIVCKALWVFFMQPLVIGICWVDGYLDGRVANYSETHRQS